MLLSQDEELESSSADHPEDLQSSSVKGDVPVSVDPGARTAEEDNTLATEPVGDTAIVVQASSHLAEIHNTADDAMTSAVHPAAEAEVDFIDAEQLVASLFGDDDSSISFEQPPMPSDSKKGFVSVDHEDANRWFYQDPQGIVQGKML